MSSECLRNEQDTQYLEEYNIVKLSTPFQPECCPFNDEKRTSPSHGQSENGTKSVALK